MSLYRRSPLRFLAPVALIAFGVALLMVIQSYGKADTNKGPSASEQAKAKDLQTDSAAEKKAKKKKDKASDKLPEDTYSVKAGDTLGSIAEKTGIPIEKLQELNPELDPQQLVSGQKIKLRE